MNYTELKTALEDTAENHEETFIESLPRFVRQAEQRIYNSVLFPALRKTVTGAFTQDNKFLSTPSDFLAVSALAVIDGTGAYEFLIPKDVNFIRQAYPVPTSTGLPQYYAIYGPSSGDEKELTFIVGPTPDTNYTAELHYYYYPTSMVDSANGRTWLGDNFDTVLLYGALVEAYIFMKGEADVLATYEKKYEEALAMAKRLGNGLERGDTYRSGEPRVQVS